MSYVICVCQTYIELCFCFVCLRLMYPLLPVSLDCPFLIASSVSSNVYSGRVLNLYELKKFELHATRIVTGLPIFTKSETGWEMLKQVGKTQSERRYHKQLYFFF